MAKTYKQIMDEARQIVPEVSPEQVKARLDKGEHPVVLDVREKDEVRQGYVPGALSLPRGFLEMRVEDAVPDKNAPIVAYCAGGTRSLLAGRILKELGYTNVVSMRGGSTAGPMSRPSWYARCMSSMRASRPRSSRMRERSMRTAFVSMKSSRR